MAAFFVCFFHSLPVCLDRDPGLNGMTGVTIHGEEGSIAQAKQFIQDLIAVK